MLWKGALGLRDAPLRLLKRLGLEDCSLKETKASAVTAAFTGNALLRVRATVAHDSYEQLISCCCEGDDHQQTSKGDAGLSPRCTRPMRCSTIIGFQGRS